MWAAIYPGQGSQHVGMGRFLFEEFKTARLVFEEASDALSFDLAKLCFSGEESELALTRNTQPALLAVSVATYRVLSELMAIKFLAAAGHSVGEYAALVNLGAMRFQEALRAVRRRGEAMQSAVPVGQGAMAAVIGLEPSQVLALCEWAQKSSGLGPIEPANFNAPGQIVISGLSSLIEWIPNHFKPESFAGAPSRLKLIPLKVSAPFHCSLMRPAEEVMRAVLEGIEFHSVSTPIVQNVNAQATREAHVLRENLIQQISRPVRWVECVQRLKDLGATCFVELGSGNVLKGLVKKIDSENLTTFNVNSLDEIKRLENEVEQR